MGEALLEALFDSLKALPILLIVYILIEFMEHKGEVKFEKIVASSKKYGPLWGSGLGVIPQCGFSAVMADLFSRKMITIGTLFSVFVATSDEAFAILFSTPERIGSIAVLIALKLALAIVIGYALDLIFKNQNLKADNLEHSKHIEHSHSHKHSKEQIEEAQTQKDEKVCGTCAVEEKVCDTCDHDHLHHTHELENETHQTRAKVFWHIVLQGVLHTLEIFAFILIANLLIALLLNVAGGEEALEAVMGTNAWYQPLVCALIGLIPNCAGSVALVELYTSGIITFSSCLGGLCAGAGVGLLVLYKNNRDIKQNLAITFGLYLFGAFVGMLFNLFMPAVI